jgi:iron complex transport system substrate-binding protein
MIANRATPSLRWRALYSLSALLIGALAGCGAPSSTPAPDAASPAASTGPSAAASASAGPSAAASTAAGATRSFQHLFGATDVPTQPQRIVAADLGAFIPTLGTLAALGVRPVAVTADQTPEYLAQQIEGVQVLRGQANYEAIAALKPDLIITPGVEYNRENYDTLAKIAPTAAPLWYWQTLDQVTGYWRAVADLVGKPTEGEQLVTKLNERIAALRTELEPRMQGKTVSVFQVQGPGLGGLYLQTGRLESSLIHALGIARPANQTYDPNNAAWYVDQSPELLPQADAWAIFVEVYAANPDEIPAIQQQLEANPLWQQLDAVKNKRVFYVETDAWSGTDPFVANSILNLIESNLTSALDDASSGSR